MKTLTFYGMAECPDCINGIVLNHYHDEVNCDRCHGSGTIETEETETIDE